MTECADAHTHAHTLLSYSLIFLWRTVLIMWSPGSGPFYHADQWLLSWSAHQVLFFFAHSSAQYVSGLIHQPAGQLVISALGRQAG